MKIQIYSVYDKKTLVYKFPFYAQNDEHAKRLVKTELSKGQSEMALYPEDFSLNHIGSFNDSIGKIEGAEKTKTIIELLALFPKSKE